MLTFQSETREPRKPSPDDLRIVALGGLGDALAYLYREIDNAR